MVVVMVTKMVIMTVMMIMTITTMIMAMKMLMIPPFAEKKPCTCRYNVTHVD